MARSGAPSVWSAMRQDASISAVVAGAVAVLVGFTSSVAIVFQAAMALGADQAMLASWMWAIGLGMGLCTAVPALLTRQPVMVAWSTPGAAVIATAAAGGAYTMAEGVGAFMVSAALITLMGITGWFEKSMSRLPMSLANALLAGVLARFALDGFAAAKLGPVLVTAMVFTYLLGRRAWPRYAIPAVLALAVVWLVVQGRLNLAGVPLQWTWPVWTTPAWSWSAVVGLALPLFVVTMASQNLPGVAAIRACGYSMPISRLISLTGVATLLLAPFGAFALNLSAITAAIVMGPEAHEDPRRRYIGAVACGLIYILIGLGGAAVAAVLTAFPKAMVLALAGLALVGSISGGLHAALQEPRDREAAMLTFLVTLSGLTLAGVGSAFWGVVAGLLALLVSRWRVR